MLLTVTGRRTGRAYTILVGRHQAEDGTFLLSASGNWRHNLHGGTDVRLLLDGRQRTAQAVMEEDPDRTAELFRSMLERAGARALAVKVNVDRLPSCDEIKPALAVRGVAYLHLTD